MTLLHNLAKFYFWMPVRVVLWLFCLASFGLFPSMGQAQAVPTALWNFNPVIQLSCVAYSPDGSLLAMGGEGGLTLYSVATTLPYRALPTASYFVNSVAFSPDGNTVAVGEGGYVELFNLSTGKLTGSFKTAANPVYSVAYSKSGTAVAVGGETYNGTTRTSIGVLEVWNVASHKRSLSLKTAASNISAVAISPDGKTLAAGGGNASSATLELWNCATGALIKELISSQPGNVSSVVFTPDGKSLAAASNLTSSTSVQIWTLATGALSTTITSRLGGIDHIAISPDGTELIDVGGTSYTIQGQEYSVGGSELWSLNGTPNLLTSVSQGADIAAAEFSPVGSSIVEVGTVDTEFALGMELYFMPTSGFFNINSSHGSYTGSTTLTAQTTYWPTLVAMCYPAFSYDGKLVAGGGWDVTNPAPNGQQGFINVWDTVKGTLVGAFPTGLTTGTASVAFSHDSQHVGVFAGGYVKIWNIQTGALEHSIVCGLTGSFTFSSGGKYIAVSGGSSGNSVVAVFDLTSGEQVSTILVKANESFSFAVSPDSSTIATGGTYLPSGSSKVPQATLQLWDAATGSLIASLATQQSDIGGVAFSPDGTILAAGGYYEASSTSGSVGTLELWNVAGRKLSSSLPVPAYTTGLSMLSYSPNGKDLYAFDGGSIQVYDTVKNKMTGYVSVPDISFTTLSPDGTHLASFYNPADILISSMPTVTSAPLASLSFSPAIVENGSTTGTVTLTQPAPAGGMIVEVSAKAAYPAYIVLPQTVTVPAGKMSVSFPVTCSVSGIKTPLSIEAYCGPYTSSTTLTILPRNLKSITVSQSTVVCGSMLSANVTIDGVAGYYSSDVLIKSSSSVGEMTTDAAVDSGQTTTTFNIYTLPVTSPQTVTITASAGTVTKTVSFTVLPLGPQSVSLSPATVTAGGSSVGTVTLNAPAGSGGVVVTLGSSETAAGVPASITIPAGSTTGSFTITTKAGSGKSTAVISASVGATKASAKLKIT